MNIKKIADGFPGMAVLLVEEYLKEQHIDVHTVDHVVKKLLKFEEGHESEQEIVMRSLSLFQPFPYRNEYKEAYRFIRNDEGITPLYGKSPEEKRHLFSHTINLYDNSLIEITQSWLNVRPFPLAVWLVGKWFEDDPDEEEHFDNSALNEGLEEYIQKYLTRDLQGQKRMVRMGNLYLPLDAIKKWTTEEGYSYMDSALKYKLVFNAKEEHAGMFDNLVVSYNTEEERQKDIEKLLEMKLSYPQL